MSVPSRMSTSAVVNCDPMWVNLFGRPSVRPFKRPSQSVCLSIRLSVFVFDSIINQYYQKKRSVFIWRKYFLVFFCFRMDVGVVVISGLLLLLLPSVIAVVFVAKRFWMGWTFRGLKLWNVLLFLLFLLLFPSLMTTGVIVVVSGCSDIESRESPFSTVWRGGSKMC